MIKGQDPDKVLLELLKINKELVKDYEVMGIYYGKNVKKEHAEEIAKKIEEMFLDLEVDVTYGGQPFYYYLVSLE